MNSETEQLYKMVEKLDNRQDETNEVIRGLTEKLSELVAILAKNEAENSHIVKRVEDCENRLTNHGNRISECEKIQHGQIAERKLMDYVLKPLIGFIVIAAIGGAFYAFGLKG